MATTCPPLNRNGFKLKDKIEKLARGMSCLLEISKSSGFWFSNHGVSLSLGSNSNIVPMFLGLSVKSWREWMLRHSQFNRGICVSQHSHLFLRCLLHCFQWVPESFLWNSTHHLLIPWIQKPIYWVPPLCLDREGVGVSNDGKDCFHGAYTGRGGE